MNVDEGLLEALVAARTHCRDAVPVYRLKELRVDDLERRAVDVAQRFGRAAGFGPMRHQVRREADHTAVMLQEGIAARVFHASGAIVVGRGWAPLEHLLDPNGDRVDAEALAKRTAAAVDALQLAPGDHEEQLRFERLWRQKAGGITRDGERTPAVLTRVVGAFRRFVSDLPVWGRASVFVELAAEGAVASAGVDWRPVGDIVAHTRVLPPEEGARRALAELQSFLPGGRVTREHYVPERFALGYFSLPKRRAQTVLQPVYVAAFAPNGPFPSLGRIVVVPATSAPFEPMCRPLGAPPWSTRKAAPKAACGDGR